MLKKTLSWVAALAMLTGATAANAADVTPLPRDWTGFYTGVQIGIGTRTKSSLKTSSEASSQGYCLDSNGVPTSATDSTTCTGGNPPAALQNVSTDPSDYVAQTGSVCVSQYDAGAGTGVVTGAKNNNGVCPDKQTAYTGDYCTLNKNGQGQAIFPGDTSVCTSNGGGGQNGNTWVSGYDVIQDMIDRSGDNGLNFLAGINAGYNFQAGQVVFGAEADFSGLFNDKQKLSAESDAVSTVDGSFITTSANGEFGLSNVGTLRARLGYDIDGKWMPFITGGLAWGRVDTEGTATYTGYDTSIGQDVSATHRFGDNKYEMGWTAGAGINYRVADNAFIGLTYLYTDLGSHKVKDSYSYSSDYVDLNGGIEGKVDAKFHQVRLSFDVMW